MPRKALYGNYQRSLRWERSSCLVYSLREAGIYSPTSTRWFFMTSTKDFITRTAELYQCIHSGIDMDLFVYTPDEFERRKDGSFLGRCTPGSGAIWLTQAGEVVEYVSELLGQ